jgi:signal transduction histidine kinase
MRLAVRSLLLAGVIMLRSIKIRLALSYAGIALLVTLSLGVVLILTLRSYYSQMDLAYLDSNADAVSSMAVPMLSQPFPVEMQNAQASSLSFLTQTRVRILDAHSQVIADSGSVRSTDVGLGVVQSQPMGFSMSGGISQEPSTVIIVRKETGNSLPEIFSGPMQEPVPQAKGSSNVLFISKSVQVNKGLYGFALNDSGVAIGGVTNQVVQKPVNDSAGALLGYVELSESPAYGQEVLKSVIAGLTVAGAAAILLAIAAGWLAASYLTIPLSNLTSATQEMSKGNLAVRVVLSQRGDELGNLGNSFNQMAERIEETVRTLRRFLADAAHELQTPMTALRTNLELAKSDLTHAEQVLHLDLAIVQIDRIQLMVRNLLTLSRLESAAVRAEFQRVDLLDLVLQVSEIFAGRAEQAEISFSLELGSSAMWVNGNAEQLSSAVGNLLDNALKFTPKGGSIKISLADTSEGIDLSIRDTGIGIPGDEIQMLFNRFHRGRNASSYPGSGLGLAIARAVIHAHSGKISASNNSDGGATFMITLPKSDRQQD